MSDNNQNPALDDTQVVWGKFVEFFRIIFRAIQKFFEKIRLVWFRHLPAVFNGVSRIHYYEARERYYGLVDLVRYKAKLCDLNFPDFERDSNFQYSRDLKKIENEIRINTALDKKTKEQCYALLTCYESLIASKDSLTRKQGDLNRLWRTMARVRSRIIGIIVTPKMQAEQLYFCKEEAFRLGVEDDPSIKSMLQELAETIDSNGNTDPSPKYNCVLSALIERFNTIRTGRIHQQFVNVKTYTKAFLALLLISFILIQNHGLIMSLANNPQFEKTRTSAVKPPISQNKTDNKGKAASAVPPPPMQSKKILRAEAVQKVGEVDGQEASLYSKQGIWNFLLSVFTVIEKYLWNNMFAFVFFGGLTGGFFSVATRTRTRDQKPGEDVYFSAYVLTKPFIGALGAIILYILIHANFVSQHILDAKMIEELRKPGTMAFGFAFIAGFSERIVFPQFR